MTSGDDWVSGGRRGAHQRRDDRRDDGLGQPADEEYYLGGYPDDGYIPAAGQGQHGRGGAGHGDQASYGDRGYGEYGDQAGAGYETGTGYGAGRYDDSGYGGGNGQPGYGSWGEAAGDGQDGGYAGQGYGNGYQAGPGDGGHGQSEYGGGYVQGQGGDWAGQDSGWQSAGRGYGREPLGTQSHDPYRDPGPTGGYGAAPGWDGIGAQPGGGGEPGTGATAAYGSYDTGSHSWPDSGTFGRPDTGSVPRPDTGSYGRPDTGSFAAADTGSYGRPDTGSYAAADTGSYGRPDTGSYGAADTGSYGRQDPASYYGQDTGSFDPEHSGAFGPVPASGFDPADSAQFDRSDSASFDRPTGRYGRQDASDGPQDDEDWDDEGDSGLLSRRFGHGEGADHTDRTGRASGAGGGSGGRRRGGRKNGGGKPRRVRGKAAFTLAMVAILVIVGGVAGLGYKYGHAWYENRYGDYTGIGYGNVLVTVGAGYTLEQLGPTLVKDGVIKTERPFDSAASKAKNASSLQPGIYRLHHHMNSAIAVQVLLSGKTRQSDTFRVADGERASDIVTRLAAQTHIPASQFTQLIEHPPASLGLPSWAGPTAEGFLYPDTYTLAPHQTALQILQMMVKDFNQRTASLDIPGIAHSKYTTPYHMLVVASLIQAEGNATDFAQVSRVVWNRIKINMLLEFDSTVFYAMGKYGTSITKAQEKFPSPYNTYLHTGLPPGPIDSPNLNAIQAALHPATGPWLYFITDVKSPTHKTYFTDSLAQLQIWQQKFGS